MRLLSRSKKKIIALIMLGMVICLLWRVFYSSLLVLDPLSCTTIPSASGSIDKYTLEMDGTTPIITQAQEFGISPKDALTILCSPQGNPKIIVLSPLKAKEHLIYGYGEVAWSVNHHFFACLLPTSNGNRLYLWQDGIFKWRISLTDTWKYDKFGYTDFGTAIQPFDNGQVLCYKTAKDAGEYLLAGKGQIIACGNLPAFAKNKWSDAPPLHFSGDGAYCYASDRVVVHVYRMQVKEGVLTFRGLRTIFTQADTDFQLTQLYDDESRFGDVQVNADGSIYALQNWVGNDQVKVTAFDLQGRSKSIISPHCAGSEQYFLGDACSGTISPDMISIAQLRSWKTWTCRRLTPYDPLPNGLYTSPDGQSVFLMIQDPPKLYYDDCMTKRLSHFPLLGKKYLAFQHRQVCRRQGIYEAFICSGRQHSLFQLSGLFQEKEYIIIKSCLLADGHTILALANRNNATVLLRYRW